MQDFDEEQYIARARAKQTLWRETRARRQAEWQRGKSIAPVETTYRGVRFRSRLEARWAVFFHEIELPWEYEPERFMLSSGEIYIPDFRLDGHVWAEVKPPHGDLAKPRLFDDMIIVLEGPPGYQADRVYQVWHPTFYEANADLTPYDKHAICNCTDERCPGFQHDEVYIGASCDQHLVRQWAKYWPFYWGWGGDVVGMFEERGVERAIAKALSERFGAY